MNHVYRFALVGILLFTIQRSNAQDNPNLDTPPSRPSFFGPPAGTNTVNVITTPDGFDNFDLGTTDAEPHISSNPLNPVWFFTAFNINNAFRSTDGTSWTFSAPNFGVSANGDPLTAYDSLGNLYYETMFGGVTGCKVIRSSDNGATWTTAVTAVAGNDKNWLACDQTMGPYANYVYTGMTPGNFARSTDFGATWTTTRTFSTQSLPGMMVAVGPNVLGGSNVSGGAVYVVTHSGTNAAGIYTFYVSTDGGLTFTQKSTNQFSNLIGTEVGGRSTVQGMRCRPYPMIAADNSFGPYRGRLYLVYASNNPSGNGNKSDIFLRYSTNQGETWSNAAIVNDDPNSQNNFQFHPAIWCDKETGRLYVKFYDTRRVPTSDSMDVYATYTDDGGQTFAPNQRLTNRTFKINISGGAGPTYRGDYDAITSNRYAALAVWADFRNAPTTNYLGMTAYFPDFAMLARATRDTLKYTDSTTAIIRVPAVKLYTNRVKFSATVSPAAPFVFTWQNGRDSLSSYPDSVTLRIRTNNVPEGNYVVTVTGQGPNGTPVHRRTIPIRVQLIGNSVAVLQPNGGEIWIQGQAKQIRWRNAGDVDSVKIDLTTNNGGVWSTLTSVPAASGVYNWTVAGGPSVLCRVRIAWTDSANVVDLSDTTFTISAPAALISTTNDTLRAVVLRGNNTGVDTLRLANSGTIALNWTSTGTSWANASPASGSVPADSTRRFLVQFSSTGLALGTYRGDLTISSNDPFRPTLRVPMRLTVFGAPLLSVVPDTFFFARTTSDTFRTSFRVRNIGTDTLRYTIAEGLTSVANDAANDAAIARSKEQQPYQELPKGVRSSLPPQPASPDGRGGPDAFGYTWVDSDEPGGPVFNWVDISNRDTIPGTWSTTRDDGYKTLTLPWSFPFYGNNFTAINIVTNGFMNFGATSTAFTNGAIPSTATPNNAIYPFWDDLDLRNSGQVYYWNDVANGRLIIQYDKVPRYTATPPATDTVTFQIILRPSGDIVVQYLRMIGVTNSTTVGIENSDGTIGLQVVFDAAYVRNGLALLFTKDLLPWTSLDRTSGTILAGDSATISLRVHPAGLSSGTYRGRYVVAGNAPNTGLVRMQLNWNPPTTASVAVTSPNGGEQWNIGQTYPITWSATSVDTVTISYSTTGRTGSYTTITSGVPAGPVTRIHPKALARAIEGGVTDEINGTFNWQIPNTPSTNCYVRIVRKSTGTPGDTSDAAFTIRTSSTSNWATQTSGVTATLLWVKVVSPIIAWAGGTGGVVLRTTNGGTTWTSVGGGAIGTADTYCGDALDANIAFTSTSPAATFIYRTTNGGATWTQVFTQAGGFIDGIQMVDATNGYALGDPVGGNWTVLRTTDGGATWAPLAALPPQVGTEAGWNNSFQVRSPNMWFGTNATKLYRSTNLGATWNATTPTAASTYSLWFQNANIGMLGGGAGVVNYTTNGGATWTLVAAAGTGNVGGVGSLADGSEWWAASGNNVYSSSNSGAAWSTAAPNGYAGTTAVNHVMMGGLTNGLSYGNAVGAGIVRFNRGANDVANDRTSIPTEYALDQNYPNPFNPSTTIHFALPERTFVTLKVYNMLGQEVATLVDDEMSAAFHSVAWLGTNKNGSYVATGMYFYRLSAGSFVETKKMILTK